jgi:hypothetical protein
LLHTDSFIYRRRYVILAIISVFQVYRHSSLLNALLQSFCLYLCKSAECGSTKCLYSFRKGDRHARASSKRRIARTDAAAVCLRYAASII